MKENPTTKIDIPVTQSPDKVSLNEPRNRIRITIYHDKRRGYYPSVTAITKREDGTYTWSSDNRIISGNEILPSTGRFNKNTLLQATAKARNEMLQIGSDLNNVIRKVCANDGLTVHEVTTADELSELIVA